MENQQRPARDARGGDVPVVDLRHTTSREKTRVLVGLQGAVEFSEHRIGTPDRFYVDLRGARLAQGVPLLQAVPSGPVRKIRIAQYDAETVRLVLDLGQAGDTKVVALDNRLIVDVFPLPVEKSTSAGGFTVVLDPGHGGEDPGALGPGGVREKDIVLDVARRLRERLSGEKGVRVVLTRDRDEFIPLLERIKIANRERADLFVSLHVNAVAGRRKSQVRGIETYLLNWTSTKEAEGVAARENRIMVRAGEKTPDMSFVEMIFSDLSREYKRDESLRLAHLVQNAMVGELRHKYAGTKDLGVKQGRFFVLVGATMPAVLAEISFVTHPEEGRLLGKSSYRASLAEGIARGVLSYLEPETLARRYP